MFYAGVNRRQFIGLLGGALAASVAPQILIPRDGAKSIVPARPRDFRGVRGGGVDFFDFDAGYVYAPYMPLYVTNQLERYPDGSVHEVTRAVHAAGDFKEGDIVRSQLKFTSAQLQDAGLTVGCPTVDMFQPTRNAKLMSAYAKKVVRPEYFTPFDGSPGLKWASLHSDRVGVV